MLFNTPSAAQRKLAEHVKNRRLLAGLTQEGLALRSGVSLPTLRKFEQKELISLESFLKLLMVVGGLDELVDAVSPKLPEFSSIDEVLKEKKAITRKRGYRT
jgi:transcriptional regulator with XRE-family HTH domain